MSNKISTLIFDLGGVIVNTNDGSAIQHLRNNGILNPDNLFDRTNSYCVDYETGKISTDEFIRCVTKCTQADLSEEYLFEVIKAAWLKIIENIPFERIELLKTLRKKYFLTVLSTNNVMHTYAIRLFCQKNYGFEFFKLFDRVHLSQETSIAKPDSAAFNLLLTDINKKPEECVFIDDREINILAAQKIGLFTYHVDTPKKINELFTFLQKQSY